MNRILIVEDEITISRLIAVSLRRAGYDCTVANDGSTAADLIAEHDFDLALLDIMLPGLDGYELLGYLRPLGVPVIFITAKGATKDRVRGLQLGADDYIVKPFEIEELLARVEAVLRRTGRGRSPGAFHEDAVQNEAKGHGGKSAHFGLSDLHDGIPIGYMTIQGKIHMLMKDAALRVVIR